MVPKPPLRKSRGGVPPGVSLRKVDLSIELQILSFYQQRRDEAEGGRVAFGGLSS